jgi:putative membrane protein
MEQIRLLRIFTDAHGTKEESCAMKSAIIATALIVGLSAAPSVHSQTAEDPSATLQVLSNITTSTDFVNVASLSDKFEIDAANLAHGKTSNDVVKKLARHFLDDHSKISPELRATAKSAGMAVSPSPALDARQQAIINTLTQIVGAEFDARYIESQIQSHQESVALYTSFSAKGDNEPLKAFAAKTLPVLQQHLDMLTALQPK